MIRRASTTSVSEDGIALPTALLAMLVLLMLGGLFVAYANPQQRATAVSVNREAGLMVAETAVELAVAALADTDQPDQPFTPGDVAPVDRAAARDWATAHAINRAAPGCANFQRTANGDGIAIVDPTSASVYGVGFLPDCETRTTVRVLRVSFDLRPLVPLPATVSILTGGDIYFDHANARIGDGGIHANGDIIGTPGSVDGPYSAAGTCSDPGCTAGAAVREIPNYSARKFWEQRNQLDVNPNNDPFYELCPNGTVQRSPESPGSSPCNGVNVIPSPSPNWVFSDVGGVRTWTWTANAGPPDGQYYAYGSNIVNQMNNGSGNSSRISMFAEASKDDLLSPAGGATAGSITFAENPKFFPSWPGVGVVADVDVLVKKNLYADGQMTLVFAREQFQIDYNGSYDRVFFMSCDSTMLNYDPDDSHCEPPASGLLSTLGSPIDRTRITQNATFTAPPSGEAIVPNLGITGIGDWQAL